MQFDIRIRQSFAEMVNSKALMFFSNRNIFNFIQAVSTFIVTLGILSRLLLYRWNNTGTFL